MSTFCSPHLFYTTVVSHLITLHWNFYNANFRHWTQKSYCWLFWSSSVQHNYSVTSHQRPVMQAGTEQNPVVSWERCTVWIDNDPSVVRLPRWSGQFLTINNAFFPRSIRSVVRSTGGKPEKNPVAETRCVGQAGRGSHFYYVYYYFYYSVALGTVLALEKLCCSFERRFCTLSTTWSDPPPFPMFGFSTYTLSITDYCS
jgi:hypothetical protein